MTDASSPATHLSPVRPGTETAIDLDHIGKSFRMENGRELVAIDEVSLKIGKGEFVALLGPSGCGKSTILRLVAALEALSRGRVVVEGREPEDLSKAHRLGVAFQDHALLPWLTIAANVALPFQLAGRSVDRKRVAFMGYWRLGQSERQG